MPTNMVQDGKILPVAAAANTDAGALVLSNNFFGIALNDALTGETISVQVGGVWTLPKTNAASNALNVGQRCYWDATNSKVTPSATSNTLLGVATVAAANTDTTAKVRLNESF